MLLSQVILCPTGFALSEYFSGIGSTGVYAWDSRKDALHRQQSHEGHVTCLGQMLLFTSFHRNLDNQFRCRHQLKTWLGFSAEFHCRYASLLYCSAFAFWNLPVSPSGNRASRVNLCGLVAASCSTEHKHPMAPKTWCPQLVCWSAHKFVMLITNFLRVHLTMFFPYLGFLVSMVDRCYNLSQKFLWRGIFFKVYVQAQYRWKRIWSPCLADLLKHIPPLIWKSQGFSFEKLACRGKSGPSSADA